MALEEGWARTPIMRKWHYFRETRSLCKRWLYLGAIHEELNHNPPGQRDDCVQCADKRRDELIREKAR